MSYLIRVFELDDLISKGDTCKTAPIMQNRFVKVQTDRRKSLNFSSSSSKHPYIITTGYNFQGNKYMSERVLDLSLQNYNRFIASL